MRPNTAAVAAILVVGSVFVGLSAIFTVGEGERALVVRLGAPVAATDTPGLRFKIPFVDTVTVYDARLLALDPPAEQIILGDQKRIEAQTYTRFRIADTLLFNQSLRTVEQARAQLTQIVSSSLRRELGRITLPVLLSPERGRIIRNIQDEVGEKARPLGIKIVEVRLHRADLPLETSQAIYDRMKSERQREAKELRAQGFEWAQQIQAQAERERTIILSEAQRNAQIVRGDGDAKVSRVLAEVVGKDPQFYAFYRALQTYRLALAQASPTLVLSPDAEFLKFFKAGPTASPASPDARARKTPAEN